MADYSFAQFACHFCKVYSSSSSSAAQQPITESRPPLTVSASCPGQLQLLSSSGSQAYVAHHSSRSLPKLVWFTNTLGAIDLSVSAFLGISFSLILITRPAHLSLPSFITFKTSGSFRRVFSSWCDFSLHSPPRHIGPNIMRRILRS